MACIGVLLDKGGRKHEVPTYICSVTDHWRKSLDCAFNKGDGMKEALERALEALQWSKPHKDAVITHSEAITAINAALAQDEARLSRAAQEPVVWMTPDGEGSRIRFSPPINDVPLGWDALYTTPQQRPWVGLTHQDISNEVISDEPDFVQGFVQGARWADALLEDKNT
jgi:hypothetical protein